MALLLVARISLCAHYADCDRDDDRDCDHHRDDGCDCNHDCDSSCNHECDCSQHDDDELKRVGDAYSSGSMASGEIKAELIKVLKPMVARHQAARAAVTDDVVKAFMTPRKLRLS